MKYNFKKVIPLAAILGTVIIFYWKVIFKGLVPFPGDLLVGAYYPWLDYKWGYAVGVPIKNPLISDIFSQSYTWKSLIAESYRKLEWPLWNPYTYSGTPLLANFQSGALNPFNLLQVLFGDINGWKLLIISQSLLSAMSIYLLARSLKISREGSILTSITYTFSTFAITWSQFVNLGFAMIYLPLILFLINKFYKKKEVIYLTPVPFFIALSAFAGHFQAFLLSTVVFNAYFIFELIRLGKKQVNKLITYLALANMLGIGISSIQILPTYEHLKESIRFKENYIQGYNYGLLPIKHLATLTTPNFFGNPATGNYWGFFNYHETTMYTGIFGFFSLLWSIINFKKTAKRKKFFTLLAIFALIIIFENPISKTIYNKIPIISTSASGRIALIYVFSTSILTGYWLDKNKRNKIIVFLRKNILPISVILLQFTIVNLIRFTSKNGQLIDNLQISIRNMIPLLALIVSATGTFFLLNRSKFIAVALIIITTVELFYYNWKYIPFTPEKFIYPNTEIIQYLKNNIEFGRVESTKGPILPANTWAFYRMSSISGYEPLSLEKYAQFYNTEILKNKDSDSLSRYSILTNYDSELLGNFAVKYLLALKCEEEKCLQVKKIKGWEKDYEYGSIWVMKNTNYRERARIENKEGKVIGRTEIIKYSPNEVLVEFSSPEEGKLILVDTYTKDWKAQINSKDIPIEEYSKVFRSVNIPEGNGIVRFYYHPESFYRGMAISAISFGICLTTIFYLTFQRGNKKTKLYPS